MDFNELDLLKAQKAGVISSETFVKLLEYLKNSTNGDILQNNSNSSNLTRKTSKLILKIFYITSVHS